MHQHEGPINRIGRFNFMTAHVFVVDENTIRLHLKYSFAGIGSDAAELQNQDTALKMIDSKQGAAIVGMAADIARIRINDHIYFYVQGMQNGNKGRQGKFFGRFLVVSEPYCVYNDSNMINDEHLGRRLPFRVKIAPQKVFPKGVSESEALDRISGLTSINQMLWSLIYRKLKGNRGCTMITPEEDSRLFRIIETANEGAEPFVSGGLRFDRFIQSADIHAFQNLKEEFISLKEPLKQRFRKRKGFESFLQWLILSEVGRGTIPSLDHLLLDGGKLIWIGNEVSAGVGMRRIDIMLVVQQEQRREFIVIELKSGSPNFDHIIQLSDYLTWVKEYVQLNAEDEIRPVLISRGKAARYAVKESSDQSKIRNLEMYLTNSDATLIEFKYDQNDNPVFCGTPSNAV